jgi:hypothetical protein
MRPYKQHRFAGSKSTTGEEFLRFAGGASTWQNLLAWIPIPGYWFYIMTPRHVSLEETLDRVHN